MFRTPSVPQRRCVKAYASKVVRCGFDRLNHQGIQAFLFFEVI